MFLTPALMAFAVAAVCLVAGGYYTVHDWRKERARRQRLARLTGAPS